jgi:hypothetical protein
MQKDTIRAKLLDGTIGALSVDTCIFEGAGHKLEQGNFKHLEQFRLGKFRLVFSEITLRELSAHIAKKTEEARSTLRKGLADVGSYWLIPEARRNEVLTDFIGGGDHKAKANERIQGFLNRCGGVVVPSAGHVDVAQLVKLYFDVKAPFESSKDKKNEFPDAITMMALESWAKKAGTAVLFVTKDKGCRTYCDASGHLAAVDDLGDALSLIQERDEHRAKLSDAIAERIEKGLYPNLLEGIADEIAASIDVVDWTPEASSYCYYDPEMGEVAVLSVDFARGAFRPILRPVDFSEGTLVVQTTMRVEIEATCHFSFSVKDGIDRDMVQVGHATVRKKESVELDVLLTVENPEGEAPEFSELELVPGRQDIDFGEVGPDYSDEDPNHEKY